MVENPSLANSTTDTDTHPISDIFHKMVNLISGCIDKLEGVGPVDNRPSTDKLHHFVRKKENIKIKIKNKNKLHVTHNM